MKFLLLSCASTQEAWSNEAIGLYTKKISPFIKFEVKDLQLRKASRENQEKKKKMDSDSILMELKSEDFVVLFDEAGATLGSKEFSLQIQKILNSGKKRSVFIIGGAFGVSEEVKERAHLRVSLSKMVFNHLVAKTVILEQIYRAFSILNNLPYHNE